jgi:GRIM-19 protein
MLTASITQHLYPNTVLMIGCRPAMQSVKDMPIVQDGPPPGGFPSVRYARRLPSTGPTGPTLFLVSGAIMAYGFYLVGLYSALPPAMRPGGSGHVIINCNAKRRSSVRAVKGTVCSRVVFPRSAVTQHTSSVDVFASAAA